jgi:hypothetical protein
MILSNILYTPPAVAFLQSELPEVLETVCDRSSPVLPFLISADQAN